MLCATLKTDRLLLRRPETGDIDRVAELIGNWNVVRMLARPPYPYERKDAVQFVANATRCWSLGEGYVYAIALEGGLIGGINISPSERGPTLGYWLGEPYWGRGLISEAIGALIAEFFAKTETEEVVSGVFSDNPASLAVQRKFGFEVVGSGMMNCIPRGCEVPHLETRLTRTKYEEMLS